MPRHSADRPQSRHRHRNPFLYAKTMGELLLLVQNAQHVEALEQGRADAETIQAAPGAVMVVVQPIVECNRTQIDNGRFYPREMVFADPRSHTTALLYPSLGKPRRPLPPCWTGRNWPAGDAATTAHITSGIMFVSVAASVNAGLETEALVSPGAVTVAP